MSKRDDNNPKKIRIIKIVEYIIIIVVVILLIYPLFIFHVLSNLHLDLGID
jgi:hypothetical protein